MQKKGNDKNAVYSIVEFESETSVKPTTGKTYRSEAAALDAARAKGYAIYGIGTAEQLPDIYRQTQAANTQNNQQQAVDNKPKQVYNNGGKRRRQDVTDVIERLNRNEATLNEVMALPEIQAAMIENANATPTIDLPNREAIQEEAYRRAMEQGSFNGNDYTAPVRQERRMDIVIGLPGSGKSSVYTERISREQGARVIDTDDYREYIPEYNGRNAGAVHEEASRIKNRVLEAAIRNGDNVILSTIGANAQKLERDILNYKSLGYSVYLHLNELPNYKAMARAVGRFLPEDGSQKRYVSPELIAEYADKPTQTYKYLTRRYDNGIQATDDGAGVAGTAGIGEQGRRDVAQTVREGRGYGEPNVGKISGGESGEGEAGLLSGYDWYNNDVEYGQPPVLIESSDAASVTQQQSNNGGDGLGAADAGFARQSPEIESWYADAEERGSDGFHSISDTQARLYTQQTGFAPNEVPKHDAYGQHLSRVASNAMNSQVTPEAMHNSLLENARTGKFSYKERITQKVSFVF